MWGISVDERHREQLIPGDVALIYVAASKEFIGRAEITTAVHEWTSSEG